MGVTKVSRDLLTKAETYREELTKFLGDLVSIKSFSAGEREVVQRIRKEMEKVGFDEVRIDGLGNILGRIGSGKVMQWTPILVLFAVEGWKREALESRSLRRSGL